MITLEFSGKNVQKAIEDGLLKLNKTLEEVDIEIISPGGLFRKAKVAITIKTDNTKKSQAPKEEKTSKEKKKSKEVEPLKVESEKKEKVQPKVESEKKVKSQEGNKKQFKGAKEKLPKKEKEAAEKGKISQDAKQKQFIPRQESIGIRKSQDLPITKVAARKEKEERQERPKVEVTEEVASKAITFLENVLKMMNVDFALSKNIKDGELNLSIECDNGVVIGYRGETLDSLEYLTSLIINKSDDKYYRINLDCNDYRSKRVETLTALAKRMADRATKTGRKVVLEPMSSSSRKIIHSVLNNNERIITKSKGRDPNRRIIIIPKRYK